MWRNILKLNLTRGLSTTVDSKEIRHFDRFHDDWFNPEGNLRTLHSMNKIRIPLIRDGYLNTCSDVLERSKSSAPLKDVAILDVGCGGGILSEPLGRIGAKVTGIDANCDLIDKLKEKNYNNVEFTCSNIEDFAKANIGAYDVVVASEILEHVTKKDEFLAGCVECLKPGGSIFVTTINKTFWADFLGVKVAEGVLGLLPKGTHHYEKFLEPHRLEKMLEDKGCRSVSVQGMFYNFLGNRWSWCSDKSINYALHAVKCQE